MPGSPAFVYSNISSCCRWHFFESWRESSCVSQSWNLARAFAVLKFLFLSFADMLAVSCAINRVLQWILRVWGIVCNLHYATCAMLLSCCNTLRVMCAAST